MSDLQKILKILQKLDARIETVEKKLESSKPDSTSKSKSKKVSRKPKSLTSLIIELKDSGYFDKPKTVREITEKLQQQGWHYPHASLTHPLQRLLRKRAIGRIAVKGKWAYVKR